MSTSKEDDISSHSQVICISFNELRIYVTKVME